MHPLWPADGWTLPLTRGRTLRIDRPLVMGILNVTPDSFSDGGALSTPQSVAARAATMIAEGADILDVGGESTRPGHAPVDASEELRRVLPAIAAVRAIDRDIPISIDTRKAQVAQAALDAGADLVNNVSGDLAPEMAAVVKAAGCAFVFTRNGADGSWDFIQRFRASPSSQLAEAAWWTASLKMMCEEAGAAARHYDLGPGAFVLDPGLGFGDPPGADVQANLFLALEAAAVARTRPATPEAGTFPILIGASRKRFIGTMTGEADPAKRVIGSVAVAMLAVLAGAAIVRVHDVKETVEALRVLAAAEGWRYGANGQLRW